MTIKDITAIAKVEASYDYQYFESYLVIFYSLYCHLWGVIQWGFNLLEKRLTLHRRRRNKKMLEVEHVSKNLRTIKSW